MSSHWKAIELKIASILGGERVPVSGRTGERGRTSPDISHPLWALEVKHYGGTTIPKWLIKATVQAQASMKPYHIAPVAIIHPKGTPVANALCVLPLHSLVRIQDMLKEREEASESTC